MVDSNIGISGISAYIPPFFVEHKELDEYRQRRRLSSTLGVEKMSIAGTDEDAASMATNAVEKLITEFDIDPQEIGQLIVASEGGVDDSKPVSSFVVGNLNLPSHVQNYELKFACVSGAQAIYNQMAWIRSGMNNGKKGIVVTSDIAKYEPGTAEPTQGAGSIAMLIDENPKILSFDLGVGKCFRDINDFGKDKKSDVSKVKPGRFSLDAYINTIRVAFDDYITNSLPSKDLNEFDKTVFHTPYPALAKKMNQILFGGEKDAMIAESLMHSSQIGNIYTGSTWLALMSLLDHSSNTNRILIGPYGSGAGSIVFGATVRDNGFKSSLSNDLEQRIKVDPETYHNYYYGEEELPLPKNYSGWVLKEKDEDGFKTYGKKV